jgi:hypothetical protein
MGIVILEGHTVPPRHRIDFQIQRLRIERYNWSREVVNGMRAARFLISSGFIIILAGGVLQTAANQKKASPPLLHARQ